MESKLKLIYKNILTIKPNFDTWLKFAVKKWKAETQGCGSLVKFRKAGQLNNHAVILSSIHGIEVGLGR